MMSEVTRRKDKKRILVVSNACFSNSDSNGRTLAKLFTGFPKEELAQFYVYGTPDFNICDRYYQVSDRDAFRSFLKQRESGGMVKKAQCEEKVGETIANIQKGKIKKTPFSLLLREVAWKIGKWNGKKFQKWIDDFSPQAVLIFLGDNIFLVRFVIELAKKRSIPVYVYSTEEYCFKNYNYLTRRPSLFYWIFYRWLKGAYKKLEPYVKYGIYNTPMLKERYEQAFSYPCECVFSPSDIDFINNSSIPEHVKVSYLGNMGVGRHKPLIEIANALGELMPGVKLDIYGKLPRNEEIAKMLVECDNISYKGFINYEDVVHVIHESTLLIHGELDDYFYSRDLKYAFSTKIADSVCSGTPFFMYARADLAGTDFLIKNQCAFVATNKNQLKEELRWALIDSEARRKIVNNAKKVRDNYFVKSGLKELLEEMI